jgi:hypothetical protein
MELTQVRLKELLTYDPRDGVFLWNVRRSRLAVPGSVAGTIHKNGRYRCIQIKIDGRHYKSHRLAWLYVTGSWPSIDVDHRDGNALNNRWDNLREATKSDNQKNRAVSVGSKTGVKGVSPVSAACGYARPMYAAHIQVRREKIYLGTYPSVEEAQRAYWAAEAKYFGEWARPCKAAREKDRDLRR